MQMKKWLIVTGLLVAAPALATPPANVEYSADWSMETAEGAVKGKIYQAPNKERREMNNDGEKMVMIMRRDKKMAWNLMPSERMYMEMKMSDPKVGRDDPMNYDVEQTTVGPDTVNGVKTTKSKIIMKEKKPNGAKMGGFWWMTKDNIMMKLDVIAVDKGKKDRMKMELDNLKIGKQDASLFEVPSGYSKMDMSMGGMGQMMMGGEGGGEAPAGDSGKGAKEKGGFGIKDAIKLLK
ncbi:MAG: DUF4412 domain-containing protein [Pseudomonadota bacterium]